jgi:hypothetical protein
MSENIIRRLFITDYKIMDLAGNLPASDTSRAAKTDSHFPLFKDNRHLADPT